MTQTPQRILTGRAVSAEMVRRGVTADDLASAARIPVDALELCLSGEIAFDVDQLAAVGAVMGVRGADLMS